MRSGLDRRHFPENASKFPGNSAEAVIISHKGGFSMAKDKGPKKEVKKPKKKK
jgi:hypothetical protein